MNFPIDFRVASFTLTWVKKPLNLLKKDTGPCIIDWCLCEKKEGLLLTILPSCWCHFYESFILTDRIQILYIINRNNNRNIILIPMELKEISKVLC